MAYAISAAPLEQHYNSGVIAVPKPPEIGQVLEENLPDGRQMRVTYRGEIPNGVRIQSVAKGDMYKYLGNYWIWTTPLGGGPATWIDP
jgi:hypothetical protein